MFIHYFFHLFISLPIHLFSHVCIYECIYLLIDLCVYLLIFSNPDSKVVTPRLHPDLTVLTGPPPGLVGGLPPVLPELRHGSRHDGRLHPGLGVLPGLHLGLHHPGRCHLHSPDPTGRWQVARASLSTVVNQVNRNMTSAWVQTVSPYRNR